MKKETYEIALVGCDDSTLINMELSEDEYALLDKVSKKVNETSEYGCMPKMYINKLED